MRKNSTFSHLLISCLFLLGFYPATQAQQLKISDFAAFGSDQVRVAIQSSVQGGAVGSNKLIKSIGQASFTGNLHSGRTIDLGINNTVNGIVSAANSQNATGTIFNAGFSASLTGNIDVKGNVSITSGTVVGRVTIPTNRTYSGPAPTLGVVKGTPVFPQLPALPAATNFLPAGSTNINTTRSISPGAYNNLTLNGGKTVTFSGPGEYRFNSIKNTGSVNTFIFDFQNNPSGTIRIYVHGDIDMNIMNINVVNNGSATTAQSAARIFTEAHGNGSTCADGPFAFTMKNYFSGGRSNEWLGTVFTPYSGINIGSLSSSSNITGALWSAKDLNIQVGVKLVYAPFIDCNNPTVNAGADTDIPCSANTTALNGTTNISSPVYSWTTTNGSIVGASNTASITIASKGTYTLTVSNAAGCTSTDQVSVTSCLNPFIDFSQGKVVEIIGSELSALQQNPSFSDQEKNVFVINQQKVLIEVIAVQGQLNAAFAKLTELGFTDSVPNGLLANNIITGLYPINNLAALNTFPELFKYVRPAYPPVNQRGIAETGGDKAMETDFVRSGYKVTGAGINVGIISDSYNTNPFNGGAAQDVINGDLPNNVNVLPGGEFPYGSRSDEGRAMMQLMYDIAPDAIYNFHTGFISEGNMALGILRLKDEANCDIIVDDITFVTEPFYKRGAIETAIADVTARGTKYFTSAGNFGGKSYEGTFTPVPAPPDVTGQAHQFASGDILQKISLKKAGNYMIVLQWENPFYSIGETQGSVTDLDIYLTDITGKIQVGYNRINVDPFEVLPFTVSGPTETNVMIVSPTGSPNVRFKYVIFRGDAEIMEHTNANPSTIIGHANATDAITVGAIRYTLTPNYGFNGPFTVESFSSIGGMQINGVERSKPDVTAPQGVNTSVFLADIATNRDLENDGLYNFFGTSAAAPHAAAATALIMQAKTKFDPANPQFTQENIRSLLKSTALDIESTGFDYKSGSGLIRTGQALFTFAAPIPEITQLLFDQTKTPGQEPLLVTIQGNFLTPDAQVYLRDQPIPTNFVNQNQVTANVPAYGVGNPEIKVFNVSRSPSGLDGGFSNAIPIGSVAKKIVKIKAVNTVKKYGEKLPEFSSVITVNDVPLANSGLTQADLGLNDIIYETSATSASDVGLYGVKPKVVSLATGFTELYTYQFATDSRITIEQLPITITPVQQDLVYGQAIQPITFSYVYDDSKFNEEDKAPFLAKIKAQHEQYLIEDLAFIDTRNLVNGVPVTNADLNNLALMISARAIENGVATVNGVPTVNGVAVVNVDPILINQYNQSIANGIPLVDGIPTLNGVATVNGVAVVNGVVVVNGDYNVNGLDVTNGVAVVNGVATVNGVAIVNGVVTVNGVPVTNGVVVVNGVATVNGVPVTNGVVVVNGVATVNGVPVTNNVVVVNGVATVNGVAVTNGVVVVNGVATVNGVAVTNGVVVVNGVVTVNGVAVTNGVAVVNGIIVDINGVPVTNAQLANGVAVVNGVATVNGVAVTNFVAINNGVATVNGVPVTNNVVISNGVATVNGVAVTNNVVVTNGVATVNGVAVTNNVVIENGVATVNGVAVTNNMVSQNGVVTVNGVAVTNGVAVVNSLVVDVNGVPVTNTAFVNGVVTVNGVRVTNNDLFSPTNNENVAVILHETDAFAGYTTDYKSINAITGVTAGQHSIVPGALISRNLDPSYVPGVLNIGKKIASVVVAANTKVYGSADPVLTGTALGFEAQDNITVTYTRIAGEDAGTYVINAVVSPAEKAANYEIAITTADFTITKKDASVIPANNTKVYGSLDPAPLTTGAVTGFNAADGITVTYTREAGENAGVYIISFSLTDPNDKVKNYNLPVPAPTAQFTITKTSASVIPANKNKTYGDPDPVLTGTVTGFLANDGIVVTYNRVAGENAGTYVISYVLSDPNSKLVNYNLPATAATGIFTINKKAASVTPANNSKNYGSPDPVPLTTGTLTGFIAADAITANYTRQSGELANVNYTISATLSPAAKLVNYTITYNTATFTINKTPLTIKANDTYVNQGSTPVFTVTTTPMVNCTSVQFEVRNSAGVLQTVALNCLAPGTYTVTPKNAVFANSSSYVITYVSGILIVNVTSTAKAIKPILDCVTEVANPSTNGGFRYIANFSYINDNTTDVWIPAGSADNKISPIGTNVDTRNIPSLFKKGGGKFQIPFDGTKITWYLSSFDKNKKTASTSQASSTSARCPAGVPGGQSKQALSIEGITDLTQDKVYPNPVQTRVFIETNLKSVTERDVTIVDIQGRELRPASVRKISANKLEVNLGNLNAGQYYIRISNQAGYKLFRIIKQ